MRPVKSKDRAIERLLTLLPNVHAHKEGRTWHITADGSDMETEKTKSAALAWLADLAYHAQLDPADVAWVGSVPTRGLAAWEQAALEWLQNGG